MKAVHYTKVQNNSNKPKRIYIEGSKLAKAGFDVGKKYVSIFDIDKQTLTLVLDENGDKKVSKRKKRGFKDVYQPVIDLCNANVVKTFGEETRLRLVISEGEIVFTIHHEEEAKREREARLVSNLSRGEIREASLCTGIGVSTHAIHKGFEDGGVKSKLDWVCEIEDSYLNVADQNNDAFTEDTKFIVGALEEVEPSFLSPVDVLSASLPCTGHSKAGKASNKIKNAEDHKDAATSVFGFMNIIKACQPSIIISENVTEARNSATYSLIRAELSRLGYDVHERDMGKEEGNCIEKRNRYWFVAVSKGLKDFNIDKLVTSKVKNQKVGDILEDIPKDDPLFFSDKAFTKRAEENAKAGRGFATQFITEEDNSVGVIPRNYNKRQVSNPHLKGENNTVRLFTVTEHARIKGIPEHLTKDVLATLGHEGLGQAILYNHAYSIARTLAKFFKSIKGGASTPLTSCI